MIENYFAEEHISSRNSMKEVSDGSLNNNDSGGHSDEESTDFFT
jgi:hypothetical protein